MARVTYTTHDPVVFVIRDEKESIEYFGSDFFKDYGKEIPDELLQRYNSAFQEFWKVQIELEKYFK